MGLKVHQMDAETPAGGQRQIRGFAPEKRRTFHQRQLNRPVPRGFVPFPPGRWPWKAHDVTRDTHDVIQCLWRFWEAVVCQIGTCGRFLRSKKAYVALKGFNVTLKVLMKLLE
jgi:hypothetical protein